MSRAADDAAAICCDYLAAFADGDADRIAAFVTDDFVNEHTSALGRGSTGRAGYRDRLPSFLASMPELRYEVAEVIADGERVWVAYVLHARVDDRPITVPGVMRFRLAGGRIAHRVDYWDSLLFLRQAGQA